MGLGTAISGGLMLMALFVLVATIIQQIVNTNTIVNSASSERVRMDDDVLKTGIDIHSITAEELDDGVLLVINNTGNTKLWDYPKFTILVTYEVGINIGPFTILKTQKTDHLAYSQKATGTLLDVGTWRVSRYFDDLAEPKIVNPDEAVEFECRLTSPIYTDARVTVVVSTDNGVIATRSIMVD